MNNEETFCMKLSMKRKKVFEKYSLRNDLNMKPGLENCVMREPLLFLIILICE